MERPGGNNFKKQGKWVGTLTGFIRFISWSDYLFKTFLFLLFFL